MLSSIRIQPPAPVDIKEIKQLMEYMDEHELSHFELVRGDDSITLQKEGSEPGGMPMQAMQTMAMPQVAPQAAPFIPAEAGAPAGDAAAEEGAPRHYIDSPMVGTFYRSPDPDSPNFVKPGDIVEEDTTVCIIESMKVMNEIKAERRGKIVEVLPDDASPVQFDEHLFVIEPS